MNVDIERWKSFEVNSGDFTYFDILQEECRLPGFVTILAAVVDKARPIHGKILHARSLGTGLPGTKSLAATEHGRPPDHLRDRSGPRRSASF